jgi:hypothetical protein
MNKGIPPADIVDINGLNNLIRSSAIVILAHVIQLQKPDQHIGDCTSEAIRELYAAYLKQTL